MTASYDGEYSLSEVDQARNIRNYEFKEALEATRNIQKAAVQDVIKAGGDLTKVPAQSLYDALQYAQHNADIDTSAYNRAQVTDNAKLAKMLQEGKVLSPAEKGILVENLQENLAPRTSELNWVKKANPFKAVETFDQDIVKAQLQSAKAESQLLRAGVAAEGSEELLLASRLTNVFKGVGRFAGPAGAALLAAELTDALHDTVVRDKTQAESLAKLIAENALNPQNANPNRFNNVPAEQGLQVGGPSL